MGFIGLPRGKKKGPTGRIPSTVKKFVRRSREKKKGEGAGAQRCVRGSENVGGEGGLGRGKELRTIE